MRLIITKQLKLFTVCTEQVRSPYIKHAESGLLKPIHLEGEVRFIQAQDQQVLPHVVREHGNRVFTHSLIFNAFSRTRTHMSRCVSG